MYNELATDNLNETFSPREILEAFDNLLELAAIGAKQTGTRFDGDDLLKVLQLRRFLQEREREDAELSEGR